MTPAPQIRLSLWLFAAAIEIIVHGLRYPPPRSRTDAPFGPHMIYVGGEALRTSCRSIFEFQRLVNHTAHGTPGDKFFLALILKRFSLRYG